MKRANWSWLPMLAAIAASAAIAATIPTGVAWLILPWVLIAGFVWSFRLIWQR